LLLHLIHPFLPFDLMVIRQIPSSTYLSAPWSELLLATIGLICCLCAWQLARHQAWIRRWLVLALSGSVPLVLYFTYAADRYAARKYAFFFIPLIIMMMAWAMLTVVRRVIGRSWADAVGYGAGLLLLVVVGIAGVGESWPWLQPVRADLTYVQAQAHDYPTAYQFVEQRAATGDALVTLSPEYYYLRRQDLSIIQIPPAKQWKKSDVLSLRQQYAHGWIIIPRWKGKQHLTASVRRVLKKQFINAHSPTPTIDIYRW
jgi:signal transduction histidine kinase